METTMVSDPDQTLLRYHAVILGASLSRAVLALPQDQPLARRNDTRDRGCIQSSSSHVARIMTAREGSWQILRVSFGLPLPPMTRMSSGVRRGGAAASRRR